MRKRFQAMRIHLTKADIIVFSAATVAIAGAFIYDRWPAASANPCQSATGATHAVIVADDRFVPDTINANQCDQITIANRSSQAYRIAVGRHDKHLAYPGFSVDTLPAGGSFSFMAFQAGEYELHDHLRDQAHAQLKVTPTK